MVSAIDQVIGARFERKLKLASWTLGLQVGSGNRRVTTAMIKQNWYFSIKTSLYTYIKNFPVIRGSFCIWGSTALSVCMCEWDSYPISWCSQSSRSCWALPCLAEWLENGVLITTRLAHACTDQAVAQGKRVKLNDHTVLCFKLVASFFVGKWMSIMDFRTWN